jgi:ribonuclease HI
MSRKIKSIYTDGACQGNPGPGGWGVVVCYQDDAIHEIGGGDAATTNNRMEMQAAIAALKFFHDANSQDSITLYTDSEYLKNGITQWIRGWKQKGWKTSTGKPVLNQDLWETLDKLNSRQIHWEYVRGHAGNIHNERCDKIARAFSVGKIPNLHQLSIPDTFSSVATNDLGNKTIQSSFVSSDSSTLDIIMTDSTAPFATESTENNLPSEFRVSQLRNLVETLRIADEVAEKRYLITSSELADLMDVNASAVTSRGDNWVWRNWIVSRVRREGNQILWQLERVD